MIVKRPADARGHAVIDWLNSWHTFSFASYFDPAHMGFGPLRVINEDRISPSGGFPTHGHRDMEILTYVLSGALEHKDSTGGGSIIRPGELQRMSAGSGIRHSEFNASDSEPVHLLQIWIEPDTNGIAPGYEQKDFDISMDETKARLVATSKSGTNALKIRQDAEVYACTLVEGETLEHKLAAERHCWIQVARGSIDLNGVQFVAGDGAAIGEETELAFIGTEPSEFLLFDLP